MHIVVPHITNVGFLWQKHLCHCCVLQGLFAEKRSSAHWADWFALGLVAFLHLLGNEMDSYEVGFRNRSWKIIFFFYDCCISCCATTVLRNCSDLLASFHSSLHCCLQSAQATATTSSLSWNSGHLSHHCYLPHWSGAFTCLLLPAEKTFPSDKKSQKVTVWFS